MEQPPALVHFARMIQQADVRQNCAQPIVGVWQIFLQRERATQFRDGFRNSMR